LIAAVAEIMLLARYILVPASEPGPLQAWTCVLWNDPDLQRIAEQPPRKR